MPRRVRQGRAVRLHQGHAQAARLARSRSRSTASRGAEISELLPHLRSVADDIAIVRSMHTDAVQPRPGADLHEHRPPDSAGRASARGSPTAWAPRARDLPGVRRAALAARTTPTAARAAGAAASCRPCYQGVEFRSQRRSGAVRLQPRGRRAAARAGARIDAVNDLNQLQLADVGDPEIADAHRRLRAGVPHADQRARADRHLRRSRSRPRAVRHRAGQGVLRQQLPAGAAAGRARRPLRPALSPRLGHARRQPRRRHRRRSCRGCASRPTRPAAALRQGPEAARPARRHAGRSGAASSAARR